MSSAIGRDLKARNGNFNFDVQVWVKFFSSLLGFIHTGKALSFVYDVADFYKTMLTIPVAFKTVASGTHDLESRVRHALRDAFAEARLLGHIVDDIQNVLAPDSGPYSRRTTRAAGC